MIVRCVVASVLLVATSAIRVELAAPQEASHAEPLSRFPSSLGPWVGQDVPLDEDVVKVAAVDDYLNRTYQSGDTEVGFYVGYYRSQRQGESLHSPLNCLPGTGWEPLKTERLDISVDGEGPARINKLIVQKGLNQMAVLYWYQTMNRVTASEYARKVFLVADAFQYGRTDVALARVIAPIGARDANGEQRAVNLARPFAERVLPEIRKRLFRG